ncbi:hypothetical protein [Streptomyces sp. NRRL B-24484]|uniref:hypothetical protein n=1 Tax=Streptomyces sp. NRRL B-24484 TaxID=1463833 RepID=UPI0009986464|nr:hypothetical protein [Streptomyces sp. NRRL B-24484]
MPNQEWLPDQPVRVGRIDWPEHQSDEAFLRLQTGQTVVLDRQPWQVLEINEYPYSQWPRTHQESWYEHVELWSHSENLHGVHRATMPPDRANFYKRPVILVLRNENVPRSAPKHWCAPASQDWHVLPEHYAVCRTCGELPPCRNGEHRWNGGPRRTEHSGSARLIVPPGCCMGCAEPIKPRTRSVTFPGANLWYPELGEGSAIFHTRTRCVDHVEDYRREWETSYIQKPRYSSSPLFQETREENSVPPRSHPAEDRFRLVEGSLQAGSFSPAGDSPGILRLLHTGTADVLPAPSLPVHHPQPRVAAQHSLPGARLESVPLTQVPGTTEHTGHLPDLRNPEQAARVIEELTTAVRNIAAYLNSGTGVQTYTRIP